MPTYSLAGGVEAGYSVAAGRTTVTIRTRDRLNRRGVYLGTGQMLFHWVQEGKTQAWRCDLSLLDPREAQVEESPGADGAAMLSVQVGELFPAACLLQGRMVGTLLAPAVHVDVPFGSDVWVFFVRSPWFPLRLQVDRASLSVSHGDSRVTASFAVSDGGTLGVETAVQGTAYKSASLLMKRTLGAYASSETVAELDPAGGRFEWKPISRAFDLLLVTRGTISESQLAELASGLGAQESSGLFGPGGMEGDFVLCDGPATAYSLVLKGHRGFLENEEDQTGARLVW